MKKIKVVIESGYAQVPDKYVVIEVDDDATDKEINEEAFDAMTNMVEWYWEEDTKWQY